MYFRIMQIYDQHLKKCVATNLIIKYTLIKVESDSTSQVTNLVSNNQTETSIYLTWQNPTSYDSLILNYYILESNSTFQANLTKPNSDFTINNLLPGSSLTISITKVKNGLEINTSDSLTVFTRKYLYLDC